MKAEKKWTTTPGCAPGCNSNERPYCHCQGCGETDVPLLAEGPDAGYCAACAGDDGMTGEAEGDPAGVGGVDPADAGGYATCIEEAGS